MSVVVKEETLKYRKCKEIKRENSDCKRDIDNIVYIIVRGKLKK